MKQIIPTVFLRLIFVFLGLLALAFGIFALPLIIWEIRSHVPNVGVFTYTFMVGVYLTIPVFLYALYQALCLLNQVDHNTIFTLSAVGRLRQMKLAGFVVTALLYTTMMPVCYAIADYEDAPGLILIGLAFATLPLAVAAFVAVLERLLRQVVPPQP